MVIVGLNVKLVIDTVGEWLGGAQGIWLHALLFPLLVAVGALLLWVAFEPWIARLAVWRARATAEIHGAAALPVITPPEPVPLKRVALALDFSGHEVRLIEGALRFFGPTKPLLALLHVVESASARAFGGEAADLEMDSDQSRVDAYADALRKLGYDVVTALGTGDPARELARLSNELDAELVILGGHGHRGLSDMIYGTTVEALRHRTRASVLVIPLGGG